MKEHKHCGTIAAHGESGHMTNSERTNDIEDD